MVGLQDGAVVSELKFFCLHAPMLLLTGLALCSATHLALEYGYKPSTMEGTDFLRFKRHYHAKRSLDVSPEHSLVAKDILAPRLAHDFHMFLEKDFNFEGSSFVVEQGKKQFVQGIESPVDKVTLASLFYRTLIGSKHNPQANALINVSCRDYFDEDQRETLSQVCSNLGYKTKVIPESLAATLEGSIYLPEGTTMRRCCVNFRGSQTTLSLYELRREKDQVAVKLIETKPVDMASDYEIEKLVARDVARALGKDEISFLPYFYSAELKYYADIQLEVMKIIDLLNSELEEHLILEIPYYEKESNSKVSAMIERKVALDALRREVQAMYLDGGCRSEQYKALMESLPQDAELCMLTDVSLRGRFMNGFTLISNEFIVKGLNQAHDSRITLSDSRINSSHRPVQPAYSRVLDELEVKSTARKTYNAIPSLIGTLKNLKPDELGIMNEYLTSEPKTLKVLKEMVQKWDGLVKLNSEREADSILRASRIKDLDDCLAETRTFMDTLEDSMGTSIEDIFSETEAWLGRNREEMSVSKEFETRSIRLRSIKRYIEKKLARAVEDARKLAERNDGEKAPESTLDESKLTADQKLEEVHKDAPSTDRAKEVCKEPVNNLDGGSKEDPKKSEATTETVEEIGQREVL